MDSITKCSDPLICSHIAAMKSGEEAIGLIPAGYTYLGQFIAHDIVPDTQRAANSRSVNIRAGLNLDSVYSGVASDKRVVSGNRFLLREEEVGFPEDLVRDPDGVPMIPEPRNDENTIISQLHLVFLKLHNKFAHAYPHENFERIRKRVVQVFQNIVVKDYLKRILHPSVHSYYFEQGKQALKLDLSKGIPKEFSHAAFRFGHSMVRNNYVGFFNKCNHQIGSFDLEALFRKHKRLECAFKIDWNSFFPLKLTGNDPRAAHKIDLRIADKMFKIMNTKGQTVDIVETNLKAGRNASLPSGLSFYSEVERRLGSGHFLLGELKRITSQQLTAVNSNVRAATGRSLEPNDLFLWPYFLLEALSFGAGRLGVLSSLVVADVLSSSIQLSEYSIYTDDSYGEGSEEITDLFSNKKLSGNLEKILSEANGFDMHFITNKAITNEVDHE